MIRMLVAGLGLVLIFGSVILFSAIRAAWPGALEMDVFGLLILGSLAFEQRYRAKKAAGGEWTSTAERFVDPASGKLVDVRYNPATGERAYVSADEG